MRIAIIEGKKDILLDTQIALRRCGGVLSSDILDGFPSPDEFFKAITKTNYDAIICGDNLGRDRIRGYDLMTFMRITGYRGIIALLTSSEEVSQSLRVRRADAIDYVVRDKGDDCTGSRIIASLLARERQAVERYRATGS